MAAFFVDRSKIHFSHVDLPYFSADSITQENMMKYLNQNQLQSFFKVVRQSNSLRDELAFSLCLFLGLRVSELVSILLEDICFKSKQIEIRGLKNGRTWTYTLSSKLF
jgi:site-specific recombinase XerD